jgi:hypothetical protein
VIVDGANSIDVGEQRGVDGVLRMDDVRATHQ